MCQADLLSFLQDVVEQDSDLETLKYDYTIDGCGKYDLEIIKKISIYGLQQHLFELSKYVRKREQYINIKFSDSVEIIEKNESWKNSEDEVYYLLFKNIPHYFFILFGPYGPVGEHAMEGARIPEEFEQFVIDE